MLPAPIDRLTPALTAIHLGQALQKQQDQIGAERRSMVGSGDRSEKVRTYNFPQNRLTDHRIGLTLHQLDLIMQGNLDPVMGALNTYFQTEKLKQQGERDQAA